MTGHTTAGLLAGFCRNKALSTHFPCWDRSRGYCCYRVGRQGLGQETMDESQLLLYAVTPAQPRTDTQRVGDVKPGTIRKRHIFRGSETWYPLSVSGTSPEGRRHGALSVSQERLQCPLSLQRPPPLPQTHREVTQVFSNFHSNNFPELSCSPLRC